MWKVLRMSWWDAWKRALAHPADNVVAAMVVLIGVAITAVTTLLVSAANRRHERRKGVEDRLFPLRAQAYLDARRWMIRLKEMTIEEQAAADEEVLKTFDEVGHTLTIYASNKAVDLYWEWLEASRVEIDLEEGSTERAAAAVKVERIRRRFQEEARRDVQGTRRRRFDDNR